MIQFVLNCPFFVPKNKIFRAREKIRSTFEFSKWFVLIFYFSAHGFTYLSGTKCIGRNPVRGA
jgi:hypothetical protein